MNALNFHHLRYFHATARSGSLTAAAKRLNVSQSAMSVQLKQLEASLGVALFDREHKSLRLTEEGRMVLDYANTIFRTGEEMLATLQNKSGQFRKKLRIGAVTTLSRNFQLGFLHEAIDDNEVEVVIHSLSLREALAQLSAHQLDMVLSNRAVPPSGGSAFRSDLVAEQPVSLLCHKRMRRRRAFRFPEDLQGVPMVLPTPSSDLRIWFDQIIERAGIALLIAAEADDMAMLRLLAREMPAIALLPSVVVKDELESGELVEAYRVPGLQESFYAITSKRRYPNPHVAKLLARSTALS